MPRHCQQLTIKQTQLPSKLPVTAGAGNALLPALGLFTGSANEHYCCGLAAIKTYLSVGLAMSLPGVYLANHLYAATCRHSTTSAAHQHLCALPGSPSQEGILCEVSSYMPAARPVAHLSMLDHIPAWQYWQTQSTAGLLNRWQNMPCYMICCTKAAVALSGLWNEGDAVRIAGTHLVATLLHLLHFVG